MKTVIALLLGMMMSMNVHASEKFLLGEIEVNGEKIEVVTDVPTQKGDIKLTNVRGESKNGVIYRLAKNSYRVLDSVACQNLTFKNYYQTLESSASNDVVLDLSTGKITKGSDNVVIKTIICMQNAY
ncbi:hypothetical protein [Bdellovibrio sp. HCB2-146]|uniref:hypothetical protein n=1 Tax=Bdellovibrio sp. HCB2-146 TaxID=3394362 RepID=UPI0039BD889B